MIKAHRTTLHWRNGGVHGKLKVPSSYAANAFCIGFFCNLATDKKALATFRPNRNFPVRFPPLRQCSERWRSCLMTTLQLDKDKEVNTIVEPPDELDGARVIKWAWSGDEPFGVLPVADLDDSIEIFGLAICQYDDSNNVYRFSCDKDWEVQQDGVHDSVDDALRQLPDQYKSVTVKWKTK